MRRSTFEHFLAKGFQGSLSTFTIFDQYSIFHRGFFSAGVGRHVKVHRNLLAWAEAWQGKAEQIFLTSDEEILWDISSIVLCVSVRSITSLSDTCLVRFEWPDGSVYDGEFRNNNVGNHRATWMCRPTDLTLFNLEVIHSYSFLRMPWIHFNAIFSLILIHTIQYYSQWPEMFLFDGCDHQNPKNESCRLKVKAPSHGRRAKNRVDDNDIVDAIAFCFSLTPFLLGRTSVQGPVGW